MKRLSLLPALLLAAGCIGERPRDVSWLRDPPGRRALGADRAGADLAGAPGELASLPAGPVAVDLPTVLRLAGDNNLDVAFVREKVHEAYAQAEIAAERFWPTFSPELAYRSHDGSVQGTGGEFVEVEKQSVFAGGKAKLRWEVGEAIFSTLAASQRAAGSRSRAEAAEQETVLQAGLAYYDLLREHLRERVSNEAVEIARKLTTELETAVAAGRGFRGDVLRARVQLAGNQLQALRAREASMLAAQRLGSLLRLAPEVVLVPAEALPGLLDLVPADAAQEDLLRAAFEQRPEIREAESELTAGRHERSGATWGPLIPDLQAEASAGATGPFLGDTNGTEDYTFVLGWRIGPGGLLDPGRRDLAASRVRLAEIRLARVKQAVTDQVLTAWTQWHAKVQQRALAERAVKDAEEALDLNQQRQATGTGLPLEVLQAEEALTRSRLDAFSAVVDYNQAQLRVFTWSGRRHAAQPPGH